MPRLHRVASLPAAKPLSGLRPAGRRREKPAAAVLPIRRSFITQAVVAYRFPADGLIHAFKYRHQLPLAGTLAELMLRAAPAAWPDVLIPVPLAPQRLRARFQPGPGNRPAARGPDRPPLMADGCERVRHGPPQVELPWKERAKNIRGAFACKTDLAGMRVAIVDDVADHRRHHERTGENPAPAGRRRGYGMGGGEDTA